MVRREKEKSESDESTKMIRKGEREELHRIQKELQFLTITEEEKVKL